MRKRYDRARYRLPPAMRCAKHERVEVPPSLLEAVEASYSQGRYLDAWEKVSGFAPLERWAGTRPRILASRLAARLGGDRLSALLCATAWRDSPKDAMALLYRAYAQWRSKGPLMVWQMTDGWRDLSGLDDGLAADFLALRARVAGNYRDFTLAWKLMDEAMGLQPGSAWLETEMASLMVADHRHDEALEACARAHGLQPWFRPAVQIKAHTLMRMTRADEAMVWLEKATRNGQSGEVIMQWVGALREMDDTKGIRRLLDEYERLSPLADEYSKEWLASWRCDLFCLEEKFAEAAAQARLAAPHGDGYYHELGGRLLEPGLRQRRVRLTLPKVIQRHNTCGPASLAMLAAFWGAEAEQDQIADAICYDGTYDHTERQWCLDNGFAAREFRFDADSLRTLIDAGIPFALATAEVGPGHLQTVVGYDVARDTFLVQDPSSYYFSEYAIGDFLKDYSLHGPRALAFVPQEKADLLASQKLPEAGLYDEVFAFNRALHFHRRDEAAAALDRLVAAAPGHRLEWQIRLSLASYDGDAAAIGHALGEQVKLFPDDPRLVLPLADHYSGTRPRSELLAFLRDWARHENTHPLILLRLADELNRDARQQREVWKWLRLAHASLPQESRILNTLGWLWWDEEQRELAIDALRFASCWTPANEFYVSSWFHACLLHGRADEALDRLRRRFAELGPRSPLPARTLFHRLNEMNHHDEAAEVLWRGIEQHPDCGDLRLDAVHFCLGDRDFEAAEAHLEAARAHTPAGPWMRAKANLELRAGRAREALEAWRAIAQREPASRDAHYEIALLLNRLEGGETVLAHLDEAAERHPHHFGLQVLRVEWLRSFASGRAEEALRVLLKEFPDTSWVARELAMVLLEQNRRPEAKEAARLGVELAPRHASSHSVLAAVHEHLGEDDKALASHRQAVLLDVDHVASIHGWMRLAGNAEARRAVLRQIHAEIVRQFHTGAAVDAFHQLAFPLEDGDTLLRQMRAIHAEHPNLFEAWTCLMRQLADTGQREEAIEVAEQFIRHHARLPGAWRVASFYYFEAGQHARAIELARTACELNPDWSEAANTLSYFLAATGDSAGALDELDRIVWRAPDIAAPRVRRAGMLWDLERRVEAFREIVAVLKRFPDEQSAWEMACDWANSLGRPAEVVEAARAVARERPGETTSWMRLANTLPITDVEGRLEAADRAIALHPRHVEAHDFRAWTFSLRGRYEEARAAASPAVFGERLPRPLQFRLAWLDAEEGRPEEAIQSVLQMVEEDPDYLHGWEWLLSWAQNCGNDEVAARARAAVTRLAPESVTSLLNEGRAAAADGKIPEAINLFRRAWQLDPMAPAPLHELLRLLWKERRLEEIGQSLEAAPSSITRALARCFQVLAHAVVGNTAAVREALPAVVTTSEPVTQAAGELAEELIALGQRKLWEQALNKAVADDTIGMAFARYWIDAEARRSRWRAWRHFPQWIERCHEDAAPVIKHYLDLLGSNKTGRYLSGFFKTPAAEWCRQRTELYGLVSYALVSCGRWKQTLEWLEGAADAPDARGWLCSNLAFAQLSTNRDDDAIETCAKVRARGLRDHAWWKTHALLACDAICRGDKEAAAQFLAEVGETNIRNVWYWLLALAQETQAVLACPPGSREARRHHAEGIRYMRTLLVPCFSQHGESSKSGRRWYARALRTMSRHSGRPNWPWDRLFLF